MATKAQTVKIWAAARELGLEERTLREIVHRETGSPSISALTFRQAGQVIDALVAIGASSGNSGPAAAATAERAGSKRSGRRHGREEILLITAEQRAMIDSLRGHLGGRWSEERYFEGACKRLLKKPRPRTAGEAGRVIEMLKKRLEHDRGVHA